MEMTTLAYTKESVKCMFDSAAVRGSFPLVSAFMSLVLTYKEGFRERSHSAFHLLKPPLKQSEKHSQSPVPLLAPRDHLTISCVARCHAIA